MIPIIRRFGFAAKGCVYLIIGFVAARAAISGGRRVPDEQGALQTLLSAPFGKFLLGIAAAGLLAFAVWRFVEMWTDPEKKGKIARFQSLISALVYTALGIEAVRMILGMRGGGSGESETKEQAALLISLPFGHWLTIVVAVVAIAFGVEEIFKAFARKFDDQWQIKGLSDRVKAWALRLGRLGTFARGVVGTVVGLYFLVAGLRRSPSEARGTSGAIESIGQQPFGAWIFIVIAAGLLSYGLYTLVEARYRRVGAT